jgi:tetratricopeptide (TPR) repeat protein
MQRFATRSAAILAVLCCTAPAVAEMTLTASVDRSAVTPGERFTLTLAFSGTQAAAAPDLGKLPDFKAHYIGPITRMQTSGGRVEMSVSHRYVLTAPQTAGRYTIAPLRIVVDGQALTTEPIEITVGLVDGRPPATKPATDLELQVIPEVTEPWVGQRIPIVVQLRVGDTRVDDLNYPTLSVDGATVEDFAKPSRRDEWAGGRRVQILDFRTTLTPLKSGPLELTGVAMDMAVLETSPTRRRGGLFDDFFSGARRRSIRLTADPVRLDVRALPDAGKPAGFSGAVGTFEFQVEAGPTELAVGDPITVKSQIVGVGNLESVHPPAIAESAEYKAYEPTLVSGNKRGGNIAFEQVLIPKTKKVRNVPSLEFSFFDPFDGEYKVARSAPIRVRVGAAPPQVSGVISTERDAKPAPEPQPLGKDIVYIKELPGTFSRAGSDVGPVFWALQTVPVAIFLAAALYARRRSAAFADPRALRARQAGGVARKRLKALPAGSQASGDDVTEVVSEYLGARLGLPPGRIEKEHVLARLAEIGAGERAHAAVERYFADVESVRYRGSRVGSADETPYALATNIVSELERDRRVTGATIAVFFALILVSCAIGQAQASRAAAADRGAANAVAREHAAGPMESFFAGNGAYADGDYGPAEQAYAAVLDRGVESAALWFNLGNARFKQGRIGAAIAAYERSLRLAPRDPDAAANVAFARERLLIESPAAPLVERIATPLATQMSIPELAEAAAAFWWFVWLSAAVGALAGGTRIAMRRLAIAAAFLFVFFAANFAVRYRDTVMTKWVVVTAPGDSAVRFEPSEEGTEHFPVTEGTILEFRRIRNEWIQVRRRDGRRGWIPATSGETL